MTQAKSTALLIATLAAQASFAAPTLQPPPPDPSSIAGRLARFEGQTQFLSPLPYCPGNKPCEKPGAEPGQRAIQDSDIFKVGKSGSKLLFLLNNDRGLQVVSYADGPTQPKLLARVKATGNYPSMMYYDGPHDRIVVLETLYEADNGVSDWASQQSRVIVYDVKNPAAPRIAQTLAFDGEVADSRLVGDVLYVASSIRPWQSGQAPKGLISSFRLEDAAVTQIQRQELALPTAARENMAIVETPSANGSAHYYLLAVLSQTGWGWWDRQSLVEVVDITDPSGKIQPVMTISAQGMISGRSQSTIKNDTLIVTSNYSANGTARIAVETFRLPTTNSEVLTEQEAEFRKLNIDRQLVGLTGDAYQKMYQKLIADPTLGIQGRFERTADGQLRKLIADSEVNVGDTQGLSASLQDVRYDGDLLHVFWVPSTNIDPYDLFDISHPESGVKYLKRLYFDGWISRAIPMRYQGRIFVIGLGWVTGAAGDDSGKRYPQAMLFEVIPAGGSDRPVDIAQLNLGQDSGASYWTNFKDDADRDVEVQTTADGKGVILFEAETSSADGAFQAGGKLLDFDLSNADSSTVDHPIFHDGAFLTSGAQWVRRVFANLEIAKINAFSDTELDTFDLPSLAGSSGIIHAANSLELARNVADYLTLPSAAGTRGVQVINDALFGRDTAKTKLRLVDPTAADSEKGQVLAEISVDGEYWAKLIDRADHSLWLGTRQIRWISGTPWTVQATYWMNHLALSSDGRSWVKLGTAQWSPTVNPGWNAWWTFYAEASLVQTDDGSVLSVTGTDLRRFSIAGGLTATPLALAGCDLDVADGAALYSLGGKLYVYSQQHVTDAERPGVAYAREMLATIQLGSDGASCGAGVNIPGRPVALLSGGRLVTRDVRLDDITPKVAPDGKTTYQLLTEEAFDSLAWDDAAHTATLHDDLQGLSSGELQPIGGEAFGFIDRDYGVRSFTRLEVGPDFRFTRQRFALDLPAGSAAYLWLDRVLGAPDGRRFYGILRGAEQIQVWTWSAQDPHPRLQKIQVFDENLHPGPTTDWVVNTGWNAQAHFTPELGTIEIAEGLAGVQQLRTVANP